MLFNILFFLLVQCFPHVQAISKSGNRLLVVLEESSEKANYTSLWQDLQLRSFELTFESPRSEKLALFSLGERAYDHILLLPPKSKGLGPALTPKLLLDFINSEGNVLLALSGTSPTPSSISSLLLEFDIHLPPDRTSLVVDHFHHDSLSAADRHDVLLLDVTSPAHSDVKYPFSVNGVVAVPRAVGQVLGNESPLISSILAAPRTAYIYDPNDKSADMEDVFASGEQIALISALQARNSARFTILGSVEMLQNRWFDAKVQRGDKHQEKTVNREFINRVLSWTFKELGVLQVGKLAHYLNEETGASTIEDMTMETSNLNPSIYRVKNNVGFEMELSEYHMDHFIPYEPPINDVIQLEFTMLSPYHRLSLKPIAMTANSTVFATMFTLPDQHGIFNFRVNYKRPFLTNVDEKRTVSVRHIAHNEWPRSWAIGGAWPWIAGVWVTVLSWLAFVAIWIWSAPVARKDEMKSI